MTTLTNTFLEVSPEFTDEQLLAISEAASVIACQCPSYLVQLLQQVKKFKRYTADCMQEFPEDIEVHHWLSDRAAIIETLLAQTIWELMQKENLIEGENQLSLTQLSERARAIALRQITPQV